MPAAVERIVVQATQQDKRAIAEKAKKLDLPVAELMRRGAFAYEADADVNNADDELTLLADAAKGAADRAASAIDDGLEVIAASNRRIAAMEADAAQSRRPA